MKKHQIAIICLLLLCGNSWSQIKVACIGNSITHGDSAYGIGNYPDFLRPLLGSGYTVQNDGVSSQTMLKKGDYSYWKNGKLPQVFAFKPNWITIKLGTNDSKPQNWDAHYKEFKSDYLAMIDTLSTIATKPKIWIVIPCPTWKNGMGIRDTALQKMIVILNQISSERKIPIIDARTPLLNFKSFFSDGVHPNFVGADSIAHIIFRGLMQATNADNAVRHTAVTQGVSHATFPVLRPELSFANFVATVKPRMVVGALYRIKVFDAKGTLQMNSVVDNAESLNAFRQTFQGTSPGLRFVKMSRCMR